MSPHYNPFLSIWQVQNFSGLKKISMAILKYCTLRDLRILQRLMLRIQVLWDVMWWCFIDKCFLYIYSSLTVGTWRNEGTVISPEHQKPLTLWHRITFQKTLLKILSSLSSHFSKALAETMQYTFITKFFNWILVQSTGLTIASVNFLR
jgi:hypothetical protein